MSILVEKDILRFEIPIDDIPAMQILKCHKNFCRIELGDIFWEFLIPP
jgi:hypothetical protein